SANTVWTESLNDIAADRGLPVATLRAELEAGPMSADRLVDFKLMDTLGWPEEAAEAARDRGGEGNLLELAKYTPPSVGARAEHIAVVGGEGAIVTGGTTGSGPFSDGSAFSSDPIANSILEAGRNEKVKAIVFRVDSPGGSPTASDQIWRAIERVQEDGKPVVVSMGSLAASGGYYVSTGADYILASRSTITGSIGIFGGKQTISGGLERVGINPRTLSVGGDFADAFGTDPFTDAQREDLIASLKRGYDRFTGLVAEGRDMTIEDVHEVARGRVWSGADAFTRGLVDETGGFLDAIDKAKDLAGIDADAKVRLVNYPARKTGFEALEDLFGASEDVARAASVIGALAGDERLDAALTQMQLLQTERSQVMGPILIER
ncbi:MAG: signal peptide peptidase SppA, partial [Pseudomonadota bacterium]